MDADQDANQSRPPPIQTLDIRGSPYSHTGRCEGENCKLCYKYSCAICGFRSNRLFMNRCPGCFYTYTDLT